MNSSGALSRAKPFERGVRSRRHAQGFRVSEREQVKTKVFLFIFETIGTSELLLILVIALIVFGPRKLPQLSRQLGKSLADFRRASEDFKQTWEKEVARESAIKDAIIGEAMLPEDRSILGENRDRSHAVLEAGESAQAATDSSPTLEPSTDERAVARSSSTTRPDDPAQQQPARKRDWL